MTHRAPYPPEFRAEAIQLIRSSGKSLAEIGRELHRVERQFVAEAPNTKWTADIRSTFRTRAQARTAIFEYLDGGYTTHRRHSALG